MKYKEDCVQIEPWTNFLLPESADWAISRYRNHQDVNGNDTVFLIHLDHWHTWCKQYGSKRANFLLVHFSFLVKKLFHQTDVFVRVGPASFFIYALGDYHASDIQRLLQLFLHGKEETQPSYDFHMGVYHVQQEASFEELLQHAECSLTAAYKNNQMVMIDAPLEDHDIYSLNIQDLEAYEVDEQDIDMKFVSGILNFLFECLDLRLGIEMVLARMCEYFHVQQIYVMEQDIDHHGYTITHEWLHGEGIIENDHFKKLPQCVGDNYQSAFDAHSLIVCNQLEDLYPYNRFEALRNKIRGAHSLVQCALYENGAYIGYLTMLDLVKERVWKAEEVATFSALVKILNTGILQLRTHMMQKLVSDRDVLTNAWSLKKFMEIAQTRIQLPQPKALITMDIKNFKFINTEYGYPFGNKILNSMTQVLQLFIETHDCFARVDADTFVLLLFYHDLTQLQQQLSSLLQRMEHCTMHYAEEVRIICMMGVYLIKDDQKAMTEMIDCANSARKSIKNAHQSTYAFFNQAIEALNIKEHHLSQIMKQAMQDGEFVVYYQPKINIHTKRCIGLEALVRWKRSETELIPPDEFIPLFERNGFITELDLFVLKTVCLQLKQWEAEGRTLMPIAVNISRVDLERTNMSTQIVSLCKKYDIPTTLIELEITESAFLSQEGMTIQKAKELKEAGFLLSMDDFGTGYSSLNLLKELPVDILKLDKAFFQKKLDEREKIILANIVHMALQLDMIVISEGIETEEQVFFLKEIGCAIAQGYYFSKPCPMEQLKDRLWAPFLGGQ